MELLELRKFFQEHDLFKLKQKLTNYFEDLNSSKKEEFIDSVELRFLPYFRSEISNTKARFQNSGFIQELANDGIEKVNFIEKWILENKSSNTITQPQQETKTDAPTKKDFKQEVWFKVAVLFASGKMKKFYTLNDKKEFVMKPEYTAPKIAKDKTINKPNYDKNILATLNNYETKKNIFNRTSTELKEVIKHCENKKIDLDHDFIERYNLIKDK